MQEALIDRPRARAGRKPRPIPATECAGLVTMRSGRDFEIDSGGVVLRARRAASCLLEPRVGDSVVCALLAPHEVWILAILEREEGGPNRIALDGDTEFDVQAGALSLSARNLNLSSDDMSVSARSVEVSADEARLLGREFQLFASTVKLVGSAMDAVFDRISQFSRQYLRTTEGTDRVQARIVEQEARELLHQSGENVLVNGRRLIKARGAQIHFG